jgi:hypothetical protein
MHSKNPLDLLFQDIQRQLNAEAKRPLLPRPPRQSTYADPANWRLGKVVKLIHASEGPIGDFQEYFHYLSPSARRLLPAVTGLTVDRDELVFGDYWLHPQFSAIEQPIDSEDEVSAIEARFHELMEEFEENE